VRLAVGLWAGIRPPSGQHLLEHIWRRGQLRLHRPYLHAGRNRDHSIGIHVRGWIWWADRGLPDLQRLDADHRDEPGLRTGPSRREADRLAARIDDFNTRWSFRPD